jgi:hypothetical protein
MRKSGLHGEKQKWKNDVGLQGERGREEHLVHSSVADPDDFRPDPDPDLNKFSAKFLLKIVFSGNML